MGCHCSGKSIFAINSTDKQHLVIVSAVSSVIVCDCLAYKQRMDADNRSTQGIERKQLPFIA